MWLWLWLLVLVLWRNCGSIEWVFKACARHRQIFTPVTPQLYNISRMPFSESRPRTPSASVLWTTAVPPSSSSCITLSVRSRANPVQTPGPRRKTRHPGSNMPGPRSRSGPWVSSIRTGRGPGLRYASQWEAADRRVNVFVLDGGAGASGRFRSDLLRWTTLAQWDSGPGFHLKMRLT